MYSADPIDQLSVNVIDHISSGKELAPEFAILSMSVDDAQKIAQAILNSSKIQSVTVNINSQGNEGLAQLLTDLRKINHPIALDLNGVKLTDRHIICISELLKDNKLTGLDIQDCVVAWERLKPAFEQLPAAKAMTRLNISGCALGDDGYEYLTHRVVGLINLDTVMLYNTQLSDSGAALLGKSLADLGNLNTLSIGGNKISQKGIKEIFRPLESRAIPMEYINCSHMKLSDEACTVFSLLIKLGKVRQLNLEGNWFSITSLRRLKNAVVNDEQIIQLKVKGNKFFPNHKGPNYPNLTQYPQVKEYLDAIEEKTKRNKL